MNNQTDKIQRALFMYIGIAKTLNDETCRFFNEFTFESKRRFNNLSLQLKNFEPTIKQQMDEKAIQTVELLQDYQHKVIQDMIEKEKFTDLESFLAFSKILGEIYLTYLEKYNHNCKMLFKSLNNSSNVFYNTLSFQNKEQKKVNDLVNSFVFSLIENNEWEKQN